MWFEKLKIMRIVFWFLYHFETFLIVIGAQIRIYHLLQFANTPIGVYFCTSQFEAKWKSSINNEDLDTVANTMAPTRFFDFSYSKRPSISYLLISGIVFFAYHLVWSLEIEFQKITYVDFLFPSSVNLCIASARDYNK